MTFRCAKKGSQYTHERDGNTMEKRDMWSFGAMDDHGMLADQRTVSLASASYKLVGVGLNRLGVRIN